MSDGDRIWTACTSSPAGSHIGAEICLEATTVAVDDTVDGRQRKLSPNSLKWSLTLTGLSLTNVNNRWALKTRFDGANFAHSVTGDDVLDSGEAGATMYSSVTARVLSTWTKEISIAGCDGVTEGTITKGVFIKNDSNFDTDSLPKIGDTDDLSLTRAVAYFSVDWDSETCNPTGLYWDPELGVEGSGSMLVPVMSMISLALMLLVL